ncbi:MAG: toxin-antitoxin system HicB family antitoxin [Verrucomicrobiota bacterium]
MSTLTIRISDEKHDRLKLLAQHRGISVNKLMEEMATISLAEFDAENRFLARAAKGAPSKAIDILDQLDADGND